MRDHPTRLGQFTGRRPRGRIANAVNDQIGAAFFRCIRILAITGFKPVHALERGQAQRVDLNQSDVLNAHRPQAQSGTQTDRPTTKDHTA